LKYRAEIDGLRTLAVVPVILFHAGFKLFSGGFVGVDVFFVISGYLITTILIEDIEARKFSIVNFYERRARRILPALFFVMLVCIPIAWMWMLPNQMNDFSQSLIAVSLFASNILFWLESGYFDAAAKEKPLLHTWSLALEEQYYVLFPIFLILAWRFGKNRVFWMIVVMAAISLLVSEWGWRHKAAANFYLAPSRAWELFAGSIAAFVVQKKGVQKNNPLALLGLAAIVFSIFAYDETTPFPSVYALVPVVGAVLLILFADKKTFAARFLSNKAFVSLGLISYSAYLWHQPLFAFARVRQIDEPSAFLMAALSLTSIVLAYPTWIYVERPFRTTDMISRKHICGFAMFGLLIFATFSFMGHISNGFDGRFSNFERQVINTASSNPLRTECHFPQETDSLQRDACVYFEGIPSVAILGNSHGVELAFALAVKLEKKGVSLVHHTMSGCYHNYQKNDEAGSICYDWHQKVISELENNQTIDTVILSYRNEGYLEKRSYRESLISIAVSLSESGKEVILVLQAPLPGAHIDKYISSAVYDKKRQLNGLSRVEWNYIYSAKILLINELPEEIKVIDPEEIFCDESVCSVIKDSKALYFDDDHMSLYGASLISDLIMAINFDNE
jgi:peptidoglycan/LPS O-acetylase OafA/YrhL